MAIKDRLSGNEAVSIAIKQINPDVVAAFPITPSTEIPQFISQFIANGEMTTVFVPVESEHSSMSACVGASAAGARAMTATLFLRSGLHARDAVYRGIQPSAYRYGSR